MSTGKTLAAVAVAGTLVLGLQASAQAQPASSSTRLAVVDTVNAGQGYSPKAAKKELAAAATITVTVASGDSLSALAARHCGNGSWAGLYEDNKSVVGNDPNKIYPGQRLVINCTSNESAPPAPAPTSAAPILVAGLNQTQMDNAARIIAAGQEMGLPQRAFVIAVATAMQESSLYNLASTRLSESYNYPHEGVGSDHDSVGLFQQRPSMGWGSIAQCMDPHYAALTFYRALLRVSDWSQVTLTRAAQRVQGSAYPNAYAAREWAAQAAVDALVD